MPTPANINSNPSTQQQVQPNLQVSNNSNQNGANINERYSANPTQIIVVNPNGNDSRSNAIISKVDGSAVNTDNASQLTPYPDDSPDTWDTLTINCDGGKSFFYGGLVSIDTHREMEIYCPKTPGADGYALVSQGYRNAEIKIHFTAWTTDHFICYQSMAQFFNLKTSSVGASLQRNAVQMLHPTLQFLGITNVVVKKITGIKRSSEGIDGGEQGIYTFEMDAIEWIAPQQRSAQRSTTPSTNSNTRDNSTTPNTPVTVYTPPSVQTSITNPHFSNPEIQ